jgi:hypothetical protein
MATPRSNHEPLVVAASQSARGLAQSKSWRLIESALTPRSVLGCVSSLALWNVPRPLATVPSDLPWHSVDGSLTPALPLRSTERTRR